MTGISLEQQWEWWSLALKGEKPPIHENTPQCGYFRVRDRRGLNKDLAPIKRPWIAAAIWRTEQGEMVAEQAGSQVTIDQAWPWFAKYPIPYETYAYWHQHEKWPEGAIQ